jgi:hypothetical protein
MSFGGNLKECGTRRSPQSRKKWVKAVLNLHLPGNTSIVTGSYFEGNDIEIRIRIKSAAELPGALSALEEATDSGLIDRLFKIVREGE